MNMAEVLHLNPEHLRPKPKTNGFHHSHLLCVRCEGLCEHCVREGNGLYCEASHPDNCILLPEYQQRLERYRADYSMLRETAMEGSDINLTLINAALNEDPAYAGVLLRKMRDQYISDCVVHEMTLP